jgi:hypothetical protein
MTLQKIQFFQKGTAMDHATIIAAVATLLTAIAALLREIRAGAEGVVANGDLRPDVIGRRLLSLDEEGRVTISSGTFAATFIGMFDGFRDACSVEFICVYVELLVVATLRCGHCALAFLHAAHKRALPRAETSARGLFICPDTDRPSQLLVLIAMHTHHAL